MRARASFPPTHFDSLSTLIKSKSLLIAHSTVRSVTKPSVHTRTSIKHASHGQRVTALLTGKFLRAAPSDCICGRHRSKSLGAFCTPTHTQTLPNLNDVNLFQGRFQGVLSEDDVVSGGQWGSAKTGDSFRKEMLTPPPPPLRVSLENILLWRKVRFSASHIVNDVSAVLPAWPVSSWGWSPAAERPPPMTGRARGPAVSTANTKDKSRPHSLKKNTPKTRTQLHRTLQHCRTSKRSIWCLEKLWTVDAHRHPKKLRTTLLSRVDNQDTSLARQFVVLRLMVHCTALQSPRGGAVLQPCGEVWT